MSDADVQRIAEAVYATKLRHDWQFAMVIVVLVLVVLLVWVVMDLFTRKK